MEVIQSAGAVREAKGYIGERYDADAGLLYLNARYYDPRLGMFLQPDWWEVMQKGVGTNRYAYAFGDPINGKDPSGHIKVDEKKVKDEKKREKLYEAAERALNKEKKHKAALERLKGMLKRGEKPKPFTPEGAALRRLENRLYGKGNVGVKEIEEEIGKVENNIEFIGERGEGATVDIAEHPSGQPAAGWVVGNLPDGTVVDGVIHVTERGLKATLDNLASTIAHEASHLANGLSDLRNPAGEKMYGSSGANQAMAMGAGIALKNNDNWVFSVAEWMPF